MTPSHQEQPTEYSEEPTDLTGTPPPVIIAYRHLGVGNKFPLDPPVASQCLCLRMFLPLAQP